MRSVFYLTLSVFATLAAAAEKANPFNIPPSGYSFTAGEATTLNWEPTTSGTVTLRLQWGAVLTPNSGVAIAQSIPNSGSFTWTPPANLAAQPDYTVEIVSDDDNGAVNYLPRFTVSGATGSETTKSDATTTAPKTTASSTSTSEKTTSSSSSSSSSTKSPSTLSTTTTSPSTPSGTTSTPEAKTTTTGTSSPSTSVVSTTPASSSASPSATIVPNANAGAANRVSGAMMALVLGAIAVF
ncbi:hypothetical protein EYZ11_009011 [Aspergillus tanneri]|uniref:Yeast cell wall synthesis Kre9/Knh1-like N-terminal domain-containing protein n=1 Tax=Aspergillus tanneri TaxID=1220188 RepID=A0A4S3J9F7_9EURO|nr:uncharacterized protein ATNIH1004_011169 [Aspergillus tanneri]KAA8642228.1 hypothetical protein ATNIH1004_011169 [Aspergillus tanneri]THC91525.1 hypothetical protein EYZ11_009011 [Aspergillus tanneri]